METYITVNQQYGIVTSNILYNSNLSLKAKGLYAYLTTQNENSLSAVSISQKNKDSKDSIRTAIKELEKAGLLIKKVKRNKGKFTGIEYTLMEIKNDINMGSGLSTSQNTTSGKSASGENEVISRNQPDRENPPLVKDKNETISKEIELTASGKSASGENEVISRNQPDRENPPLVKMKLLPETKAIVNEIKSITLGKSLSDKNEVISRNQPDRENPPLVKDKNETISSLNKSTASGKSASGENPNNILYNININNNNLNLNNNNLILEKNNKKLFLEKNNKKLFLEKNNNLNLNNKKLKEEKREKEIKEIYKEKKEKEKKEDKNNCSGVEVVFDDVDWDIDIQVKESEKEKADKVFNEVISNLESKIEIESKRVNDLLNNSPKELIKNAKPEPRTVVIDNTINESLSVDNVSFQGKSVEQINLESDFEGIYNPKIDLTEYDSKTAKAKAGIVFEKIKNLVNSKSIPDYFSFSDGIANSTVRLIGGIEMFAKKLEYGEEALKEDFIDIYSFVSPKPIRLIRNTNKKYKVYQVISL